MIGQSRKHSIMEAVLNTASGFVISFAATFLIFPLVGIKASVGQNISVVILYTIISIVRSYVWRRIFNKKHVQGASA